MSIALAQRAARGDMSRDVAQWLAAAFDSHLEGADLLAALALDRGSLLRERNRALMSAATMLEADDGTWSTAGRLANAIKRFESRVLPVCRRGGTVSLSPMDELLAAAFATRLRIPHSQRKLYDLLC